MPEFVLLASLALLTSCVAVASSGPPLTLVDLEVTGSPTIEPGGPDIWVDDVYRGNPVDSTFRMFLTVGEHDLRILGGSIPLWEGEIHIVRMQGTQNVKIAYDASLPKADAPDAGGVAPPRR